MLIFWDSREATAKLRKVSRGATWKSTPRPLRGGLPASPWHLPQPWAYMSYLFLLKVQHLLGQGRLSPLYLLQPLENSRNRRKQQGEHQAPGLRFTIPTGSLHHQVTRSARAGRVLRVQGLCVCMVWLCYSQAWQKEAGDVW